MGQDDDWQHKRNPDRWVRPRPVRLPSVEALEMIVSMTSAENRVNAVYRTSPSQATQTIPELLLFEDRHRLSLDIMLPGLPAIHFGSGRGGETWIADDMGGGYRTDLLELVNRVGRPLHWWQRIGRGVPVFSSRNAAETRSVEVQLRAAWIGGICGLVGGFISGWLAAWTFSR